MLLLCPTLGQVRQWWRQRGVGWGGHREAVMGWRLPENHTLIHLVSGLREVLQIPRAPLVAQLVKNPPAMQETWVQSLGWEDPLEKGKATHCSVVAWRIPGTV